MKNRLFSLQHGHFFKLFHSSIQYLNKLFNFKHYNLTTTDCMTVNLFKLEAQWPGIN